MRFFIALEIPSENLLQFKAIQGSLSILIPQARLTKLDKIHLTLAFLGEQPDSLKEQLVDIIQNSIREIKPFEVTPAYIDGFPNIHHPLVLWVGVKGDIDKLLMIRERIKDDLESLHLPVDERRFVPHISIAKLNHNFQVDRQLEEEMGKIMTEDIEPIQINSIKLFQSVPEGGLHSHNTLAKIALI